MKRLFFILFFSLYVLSLIFSSEYNISDLDIEAFLNNNPQINAEYKSLNNPFRYLFAGSVVLSYLPIGMAPSACFAFPMGWNGMNNILGSLLLAATMPPIIIVGSVLLYKGVSRFRPHYNIVQDETKFVFAHRKSKSYLRIGISTAAVSGTSFLILMTGVAMQITAYFNPSELMTYGIIPDVIGGLGILICLPMMIASLAIAHWCKGQATKFTPDLSITHDEKKGIYEGYEVSVGMRVRI